MILDTPDVGARRRRHFALHAVFEETEGCRRWMQGLAG